MSKKRSDSKALGVPERDVPSGSPLQSSEDGRISAAIPHAPSHKMSNLEFNAMNTGAFWHRDQKYGVRRPYSDHLEEVRNVLLEFGYGRDGGDEDLLCAAWLHDVLEDTTCPVKTIAELFGPNVVNIVWAVTGFGKNRGERAADAYAKLEHKRRAVPLKCADRIANMRASIGTDLEQMYLKAWPGFKRMVAAHAPEPMRAELVRLHEPRVSDRSGERSEVPPSSADGTHADRGHEVETPKDHTKPLTP